MKFSERTVRTGTGMDAMTDSMPNFDYIPVDSGVRTTAGNLHCICPHARVDHFNCRNVVGNVHVGVDIYCAISVCTAVMKGGL